MMVSPMGSKCRIWPDAAHAEDAKSVGMTFYSMFGELAAGSA